MEEFKLYLPQAITEILASLKFFLPESCLVLSFVLLIITDLFLPKKQFNSWLFGAVFCVTAYFIISQYNLIDNRVVLFSGSLILDRFAINLKILLLLVVFAAFIFFISDQKIKNHAKGINDLLSILLAATLGMFLMVSAGNFLMLYISIEMVSIASYVMVAYLGANQLQNEAAIKYLLFGAVSSAVMLYGISVLYALTGSINFLDAELLLGLSAQSNYIASGLAIIMIFAGIGFKLSFVPMHFWVPDVYEGAPTAVTSFLSTAPKIAGFGLLVKFMLSFTVASQGYLFYWPGFNFVYFFGIIAIVSLLVGNFGASLQKNTKRMLAYAAVGHTGFILMVFTMAGEYTNKALLFYLFAYAIANIGAFLSVNYLEEKTGEVTYNDYAGLGKKLPFVSICFTLILISLIGLPVSAGFFAKVFIFSALIEAYQNSNDVLYLLMGITGALTTVVSLFFYLKIPLFLFLKPMQKETVLLKSDRKQPVLIFICASLILLIGLFPQFIEKLL